MSGPRGWSPAGYRDEPSRRRSSAYYRAGRTRPALLPALLSPLFGLIAVGFPLAAVSRPGYSGWAFTTLGVSAVSLAVRYRRRGGGLFLSGIGGTLGMVGSALCIWSLAAFYLPTHVPAMPTLRPETVAAAPATAMPAAVASAARAPVVTQPTAPDARVVAPFDGADVDPSNQLHANLVHVVFEFGAVLQYDQAHGMLPSALTVDPDGTVVSPGVTYAKIAPYMAIDYAVTPGSYIFTVRDTVSGMAVGVDPDTNQVVDR